ncbi:MAG TPA: hypothetical protein VFD73_01590 [Gemmatimonadales bacterium]|nr:hypothetical protein [Gemmatimonadales bacterium]
MFPSRTVCGLLLAILALISALDGYAAYAAPIFKKAGYAQPSQAKAVLALMAPAVSDDDDDGHSPELGHAPPPLISEPLAPAALFSQDEAWDVKARPAGEIVQHPPCAVPQTGPPAHATA